MSTVSATGVGSSGCAARPNNLQLLRHRLDPHRRIGPRIGDHVIVFARPRIVLKNADRLVKRPRILQNHPHQKRHRDTVPPADAPAAHLADTDLLQIHARHRADKARIRHVHKWNTASRLLNEQHSMLLQFQFDAVVQHPPVIQLARGGRLRQQARTRCNASVQGSNWRPAPSTPASPPLRQAPSSPRRIAREPSSRTCPAARWRPPPGQS